MSSSGPNRKSCPIACPRSPRTAASLRFARASRDDQVEFVSRDWRAGTEHVDFKAPALAPDNSLPLRGGRTDARWLRVNAVYSDDARTLVVKSPAGTKVLRWTDDGPAPPGVTSIRLDADELAGVDPTGTHIYFAAPRPGGTKTIAMPTLDGRKSTAQVSQAADHTPFRGMALDTGTSQNTQITFVNPEGGHLPYFGFQAYPRRRGRSVQLPRGRPLNGTVPLRALFPSGRVGELEQVAPTNSQKICAARVSCVRAGATAACCWHGSIRRCGRLTP